MNICIKNPNDSKNFEILFDGKKVDAVTRYELESQSHPFAATTLKLYIRINDTDGLQIVTQTI